MATPINFDSLPPGLPVPVDDGACAHLLGLELPDLSIEAIDGSLVSLRDVSGRFVIYVYPRTGGPDVEMPDDWDLIPGARGCTPQACAFRDHDAELKELDAVVWGVSAQPIQEQREFAERMHLPFPLFNDSELRLASSELRLPTFNLGQMTLYKRVTLVAEASVIRKVFYPVFPPDQNAAEVVAYLRSLE